MISWIEKSKDDECKYWVLLSLIYTLIWWIISWILIVIFDSSNHSSLLFCDLWYLSKLFIVPGNSSNVLVGCIRNNRSGMNSSIVIIPVILPTTWFSFNSLYSIQSPALNVTFSYIR